MTSNDKADDRCPQPTGSQSKATKTPGKPAPTPTVRVPVSSPEGVLAIIPHLLGFYPSRSLVVLGMGGQGRVRVTFRYDLPDPPDADLAADIAEHAESVLTRQKIQAAMLIGYGSESAVMPVLDTVIPLLTDCGVRVTDALRADAGRYRSVFCEDAQCCPPEGRTYDPGSHPAAAAMTEAGLPAQPDRAALARTLQPRAGTAVQARNATNAARLRLSELAAQSRTAGDGDPQLRLVRAGRAAMQHAIKCYRTGGTITGSDQFAWLAVLLADLRVRDDAWARMDPAHHAEHARLWADVVRCAAPEYVPAPASLLAFTAWQGGNGALAAIAVDRALAANPDYSMALLLGEAIDAGLPPSAARLPMTPAQVAASYRPAAVGRVSRGRENRRRGGVRRGRPPRAARASGPRDSAGRRRATLLADR